MFSINGNKYNIGIERLTRSIRREYKYNVTTEDGRRHSETRALYPVYQMTLGGISQTDYDRLHADLMRAGETCTVTLPDGQSEITFEASVDMGSDSLVMLMKDGTRCWEGLSLTFTGVEPL